MSDDATIEHRLAAPEQSEQRFRLLGQHMSDVVYEVGPAGAIEWISDSVTRTLGFDVEELVGTPAVELVAEIDREKVRGLRRRTLSAEHVGEQQIRMRTASGESRWMVVHPQPKVAADGTVDGVVIGLIDVHEQVILGRAVTTMSATNELLVRATGEAALLTGMCDAAVDRAGYLLAWYGRPRDTEGQPVEAVATSRANADYLDDLQISWGDNDLGHGPTGTCIRTATTQIVRDFADDANYQPWRAKALDRGFRCSISLPVVVDGAVDGALMVYAGERNAFDPNTVAVLEDMATQVSIGLGRLRDVGELARASADQRLLRAAIDQAEETIVVTDITPAILYANPAASRSTGYALDELIGRNPSVLQSGLHDNQFYEAMWQRLLSGRVWHGVLVNRRKTGELYEEETTIAPVHDERGERVAFVAVKRDLAFGRTFDGLPSRDQTDHEVMAEIVRSVRPTDNLHATAAALCHTVRRLDDIDGVMVLLLHGNGEVVPVAIDGPNIPGQEIGAPFRYEGVQTMVQFTAAGAWWMDLHSSTGPAELNPMLTELLRSVGLSATAYAPIRWEGSLLGMLAVATTSTAAAAWMPTRLGLLEEIGAFAGMLLGAQADRHRNAEALRAELRAIIDGERFGIVFEPIVNLVDNSSIGYEALTRFADGSSPEVRFTQARQVGLESELEGACARAALRASRVLPPDVWLSVNFSPGALLDGRAAGVLRSAERPIVVEITEHMAIENYLAVRKALDGCGDVRVAVDDAGAGFASLQHILELEPNIIKLDIGLIRGIDTDPARQALVAGLRHFAALTGTMLIAEGVQTAEQAQMIRHLGVELAQGHLFPTVDTRSATVAAEVEPART